MAKLVVLVVLASLIGAVSSESLFLSIYLRWGWKGPRSDPPPTPTYTPPPPPNDLKIGYYAYKNCPQAEEIVRTAVEKAKYYPGTLAGLIRLFFHDCFVRGCDASVLLNQIANGTQTEKQGFPNLSLRGFEVIDEAKAALEKACPRTVSCSDILAFAARDASHILSDYEIKYYPVPAGRLDGKVSFANETLGRNLPPPFADLALLTKMFADKGLNQSDMVILSGAHSIGRSGCSSFSDRVHPPSSPSTSMEPAFAAKLNKTCHTPNNATTTVPQDFDTPNVLDTKYYDNVLSGKVLFTSDAALASSDQTKRLVRFYAGKGVFFDFGLFFGKTSWYRHFEQAMVKMGNIEVKTGPPTKDYEIRETCGFINPPYTA